MTVTSSVNKQFYTGNGSVTTTTRLAQLLRLLLLLASLLMRTSYF